MQLYENKTLNTVLKELRRQVSNNNIYLRANRCTQSSITSGSSIKMVDIIRETDFFKTCIIPEYQTLLKQVIKYEWSIDVSEVEFIDNSFYITVKVFPKLQVS